MKQAGSPLTKPEESLRNIIRSRTEKEPKGVTMVTKEAIIVLGPRRLCRLSHQM